MYVSALQVYVSVSCRLHTGPGFVRLRHFVVEKQAKGKGRQEWGNGTYHERRLFRGHVQALLIVLILLNPSPFLQFSLNVLLPEMSNTSSVHIVQWKLGVRTWKLKCVT